MANQKTIAELTHANKRYDKRLVLDDVSLSLKSGTILGLIGPSGAGKTTTIRCLLGMEKLDQGTAQVFSTTMPNRQVLAKIGFMGQSDALYENLSALENLNFYGKLMGMSGDTLSQAINKYMELVDLTQFLNKRVGTFSGGMKRRLSLAITLLANPDLIVLDEPTVGIDPSLRLEIWEQLRELANEQKGIIVTTHVMDEAERCDYVGLIIGGKVFALDTPSNLKKKFKVNTIEEVFLKAEVATQ